MHLESLRINNFRNYIKQQLNPDKRVICITGHNGAGKTNLLDAIYFLCMTKSYFNHVNSQLIREGENFFRLEGAFIDEEGKRWEITATYQKGKGKQITCNGIVYERMIDHIGRFPVVFIAPDDTRLLTGGSEERRRLLDNMLSQSTPGYLATLIKYNKYLQQRNQLLRDAEGKIPRDRDLLEVYNIKLATTGELIHKYRKNVMTAFSGLTTKFYHILSGRHETPTLLYASDLDSEDFHILLKNSLRKDVQLQRTTTGIHRDDIHLVIDNFPVKKFASQGQQKTLLLALKFAQYEMIRHSTGIKPVLILDDIFAKLDRHRMQNLAGLLFDDSFGQSFLSDTDNERIQHAFDKYQNVGYFHIEQGQIKPQATHEKIQ